MKRKLVSIRRILEIRPIPDADRIEMAIVDGWQVVCKKGEFKAGDTCVYFEIDSFLPIRPEFEFLRKSSYKKLSDGTEGFRLKTIKLRGQISQGLVLPITGFTEEPKIGEDVTNLLGVTKYEPPIPPQLAGMAKGLFPGFITKTDEERIQNCPDYFEKFRDVNFEVSVKLDGTSCTMYHRDGEFGVCSRNLELQETESNTQWRIARFLNIKERLEELGRNLALQGEIIGEGIQGNNEKIHGQDFYIFSIFDIDKHCYLDFNERKAVIDALNLSGVELKHVPVLGIEKIFQRCDTMEKILEFATGPSLNSTSMREGLVFKSESINGYVVSFKAIANSYLLSEGS